MELVIILFIIAAFCGILAIVGLINYCKTPHDTSDVKWQPRSQAKPTQAERDAYYLQQFGMTEADYMATVDMYANWDD